MATRDGAVMYDPDRRPKDENGYKYPQVHFDLVDAGFSSAEAQEIVEGSERHRRLVAELLKQGAEQKTSRPAEDR